MLVSSRGIVLVSQNTDSRYLTVENCDKWYSLHSISPDGSVCEVFFTDLDDVCSSHETAYGDHCVNPLAFVRYASKHKMSYDDITLNMVIDRWLLMYLDGEVSKIMEYVPKGHRYITCLVFSKMY